MNKKIEWLTGAGKKVVVDVILVLEKEINADGDKVNMPCCEMNITANVEGMGLIGTGMPIERKGLPGGAVAAIGKLAMTAESYAKVKNAISEIENTPEWQAKKARQAASRAAEIKYEEHREKMSKIMGY